MLFEGITRLQLQQFAIQTLKSAKTMAGNSIYEPRDWPTRPELFPMLLVQVPRERKVSLARGIAQFNTIMTLVVVGRAVALAPELANQQIDQLSAQVEDALLCTQSFYQYIQQFSTVDTQSTVSADGKQHVGEFGMSLDIEIFQIYGPNDATPLIEIQGTITNADPLAIPPGETLATFKSDFPPQS